MTFDVSAVRALYPALADGHAYLDGAAGTQVPVSVIDAIAGAYREVPDGFYQQRLFVDHFACAVRADHPRLGGRRKVTLDAYCREPHVLIAPGGELRGVIDRALGRAGRARRVLVGASGFSTAVWADYSSLTLSWQVLEKLRLFGYGSFFRNGPMPNIGVFPLKVDQEKGVAAGYGVGAGAEWRFNRFVAVQASYDRLDQVGSVDPAQTSLTRNIVAARLTVDAF